jgi:hypothetical protein
MKRFGKEDCGDRVKYWYFFGKKVAKKIGNCFYLLKLKQKKDEYEPSEWYVGWHDWKFEIVYNECGYEEGNGELHISMFGWHSVFKFPWKSKRFPYGDCDAPEYGIALHDKTFWIYRGGNGNLGGGTKWWAWDLPFFSWVHVRHEVQCDLADSDEDGILKMIDYDTLAKCEGHYVPLEENIHVKKYKYDFTDRYDGEICPCTFWVEEREWRPKWLTWTGLFKKVERYIEIVFEKEVGKGKGSWKGGVVGCGYDLLPGETPMNCIKRMEKEKTF